MKSFIISVLLLFQLSSFAQFTCTMPMSQVQYNQVRRNVQQLIQPNQRLNAAIQSVRGNCFSSQQIADLLTLFNNDNDRMDVAWNAYSNVTNKQDFYDVYNSFSSFSSVFRLHDMITGQLAAPIQPIVVAPPVVVPDPVFPALNYPNANNYAGPRNCNSFLSENDFLFMVRDVHSKLNDNERYDAASNMASRSCLNTSQAMRLATLLKLETSRMEVLKMAYNQVFDEANFEQAVQVFQHQPNRQALIEFINWRRSQLVQPVAPCEVTANQFRQILEPIARENSSSTKMSVARSTIPNHTCYTSAQIKQIVAQFNSSTDKLNLAMFAFDFVGDPQSYFFEVSPLLNSSFDRQKLSDFIASRK